MVQTLLLSKKSSFLLLFTLLMTWSLSAQENRTIDGTGNNPVHPEWGAYGTNQLHVGTIGFADGISIPGGEERPNPREISNRIFAQDNLLPDAMLLSDYAWVWGQFIDHDVTLTVDHETERADIAVPIGDAYFDPENTGTAIIAMRRSDYDPLSGTSEANPRAYPNRITSFIDASNVYGSYESRANWLRSFVGGQLKMSAGDLMPYNTLTGEYDGEIDPNAPGMDMLPTFTKFFIAGDVRANENPLLTSIQTLFVREHNRLCEIYEVENPGWTDEQLYQHVRKIVGGTLQAIIYEEWLPTMGVHYEDYAGYDESINPGIMNVFSAGAYRYGHSVINSVLVRMDNEGYIIPEGNVFLRDAFFNPTVVVDGGGISPLLKGMASQVEQDFDAKIIDDLRNFLFGPPGAGGLDLAAININRGRERGLADYNTVREDFGLPRVEEFSQLSANPWLNEMFEQTYGDVDKIDMWVGMLAEDHMSNALFGETVMTILIQQFMALRDGDRFFYENDPALSIEEIDEIKNTRLVDVIYRNTEARNLQENVFLAEDQGSSSVAEAEIHPFELQAYPNPTRYDLNLQAVVSRSSDGILQITNQLGQLIYQEDISLTAGVNTFELSSIRELSAGLYYVQLTAGNTVDFVTVAKVE
jgi:heme peroxidase/type IX secretion system substrate protein